VEHEKLTPTQGIYVIGSGKGGVGKSTVTVNLAIALARQGFEVGVLDADVYGPSIPIMMGLRRISPRIQDCGQGREQVVPFTKFGIKVLSLGFFMEEARSVVWRGPMLHGTLHKLLTEVSWGHLDYLLIDLPPGTGDVPISLAQMLQIDGALVVTTPQEVAILDALKAINSFDQLEIPLIGIIENMAGFTVPETGKTYHIFGQGKAQELALRFDTQLLGSIPLITAIRRGADEGIPAAYQQGEEQAGSHFYLLAENFHSKISKK
jgi:ATP-binding protein involved in chromosome partitioning